VPGSRHKPPFFQFFSIFWTKKRPQKRWYLINNTSPTPRESAGSLLTFLCFAKPGFRGSPQVLSQDRFSGVQAPVFRFSGVQAQVSGTPPRFRGPDPRFRSRRPVFDPRDRFHDFLAIPEQNEAESGGSKPFKYLIQGSDPRSQCRKAFLTPESQCTGS